MSRAFNKIAIMAAVLGSAAAFTSCKSSESAYKKAYEQAQQAKVAEQAAVAPAPAQSTVKIAPVAQQPAAPAVDVSNEPVRSESVTLISGAGLKDFSVVCGSFSVKANAESLQKTLAAKGYAAQIAYNPSNKFYRVIATTYADKASAVQSRNALRGAYPDAWLLYKN